MTAGQQRAALHALFTGIMTAAEMPVLATPVAERDGPGMQPPPSPVSSTWSSSDSDSDEEPGGEGAALTLRCHGSSTAAVARALVRVRFLHEERQSLQQRLQVLRSLGPQRGEPYLA